MKFTSSEEQSLKTILAEYKWGDTFCCTNCGCSEYTKGKRNHDRRCKWCKKEESLFTHTALHGLSMPLNKVFTILYTIYSTTMSSEKKAIFEYRGLEYNFSELISLEEPLKIDPDYLNYLVISAINKLRPSLRKLALLVDVRENTVKLLLNKINNRIPFDVVSPSFDNAHQRIIDFFLEHYDTGLEALFKLIMMPVPADVNFGLIKKSLNPIGIIGDWGEFFIAECDLIEYRDEGAFKGWLYREKPLANIEYGSRKWKEYFVKSP